MTQYTNKDFENLECYKSITNIELKHIVDTIIGEANLILNQINGEYKEYTFHDIGHAYRVAKYMEDICLGIDTKLRAKRKKIFSELEFAIIIIVACLHDVGMSFTEQEYLSIVNNNELYLNKFTFKGVLHALRKNNPNVSERLSLSNNGLI